MNDNYSLDESKGYKRDKQDAQLGEGARGIVYSSTCVNTGYEYPSKTCVLDNKYALKFNRSNFRNSLKKEETIVRNLHDEFLHPNIIIYYEVLFTDEKNIIAMPILNSLSNYIHDSLFNKNKDIIFSGLYNGLMHMINKTVLHRDIKLDNIGIDSLNNPVYLDFGDAILNDDLTDYEQHGTFTYMSPEMKRAGWDRPKPSYSYDCDIWSLGICYYTCLIKKEPYTRYESMIDDDLTILYKRLDENKEKININLKIYDKYINIDKLKEIFFNRNQDIRIESFKAIIPNVNIINIYNINQSQLLQAIISNPDKKSDEFIELLQDGRKLKKQLKEQNLYHLTTKLVHLEDGKNLYGTTHKAGDIVKDKSAETIQKTIKKTFASMSLRLLGKKGGKVKKTKKNIYKKNFSKMKKNFNKTKRKRIKTTKKNKKKSRR